MKSGLRLIVLLLLLGMGFFRSEAQVTVTNPTNTTPNLAATYTSLANAITALNGITAISGQVIITLAAGNPQTAPVGGYALSFSAATTAANNIIIEGNGNTITSNSALTAGVYSDAFFKLLGVDYVTLQNFVMQENASNANTTPATNNMTEWGVALLHSSVTNGAQFNLIRNNTISLSRNYQNSFGIYSNARHSATVVSSAEDITNGTTGPNHGNMFYGNSISNVNVGISIVGSSTDAFMDVGNDIGGTSAVTGNTISNWGSSTIASPTFLSSSGTIFGILSNHQKSEKISYNTITSASVTGATSVAIRGIYKRFSNGTPTGSFNATITNNVITITNALSVSGTFLGIDCVELATAASAATFSISNNQLLNFSIGNTTTAFVGISSTVQVGTLNINGNIIRGTTMAGTGSFTGISNTGAVVTALNVNNNLFGDATGNAVTYSAVHGSALTGITIPTVSNTAAVSISGNNFQGFVQNLAGTGAHTYISLVHPVAGATTDNINNNTFTNLVANTSGNVTFISRSGTMASAAGATENCSNNAIVGSFSKPVAGGTVAIYNATSGSLTGNSMVQTGNNFSNISLTGLTVMTGWNNTEGSTTLEGPTKTITNNIFSNWTCGSGAVTCLLVNNSGSNTGVSGNTISNISTLSSSATTAITGISIGSGNRGTLFTCLNNTVSTLNNSTTAIGSVLAITGGSANVTTLTISGNTVANISSDAAAVVSGIRISNGVTINVSKNKIYNLTGNNSSASVVVSGIEFTSTSASTTMNVSNNLVGDLKAPLTDGTNVVRGINFTSVTGTSTYNIFYNTVYLNASSSAANFGTSALYLIVSGTATSGTGVVRNNIFVNTSTPAGVGLTVTYRRNGGNLANFSSSSNNNIYYAGTPSASRLIFYDGTNSDQTLAAYQARVTPRETASFTEMPPFLSTSGASAGFLHLDPALPTQAESGAVNITGYSTDYDNDIRQGNGGYTGTGTAPDIGADELEGTFTELNPPVITYTALTALTCSYANQTISGVTITDVLGVPLSGANRPRIYYRKNGGSWFSQPGTNTSGTSSNGVWSFTIVVSDMGGVTGGDIVSYYIIAQDLAVTPNVISNPATGLVATGVNAITTHPTNPNTYGLNYILNGLYTVGSGGNFTTLTAAVNAYNNACNITGPVVFELKDNAYASPAETFPLTINNHAAASAINTLTIRPSLTATPTITGNAAQVFVFNGARFIRLDGRQGGTGSTRSMTIVNAQANSLTLQYINDAKNDELRYCTVQGNSQSAATGGVIVFGASDPAGSGNDNHVIEYNDIRDGSATPANAILSSGTSGRENDNITISNNLIRDYFLATARSCGIYVVSGSSGWTITGNRFYQTSVRNKTSNADHYGMFINLGTGYTITNNVIGFANENGTGTTLLTGVTGGISGFPSSYAVAISNSVRFLGISCSLAPGGTPSIIQSNLVGGMALYTSSNNATAFGIWCGVYLESGDASITNNIIGSATGTGSVYVTTSGNGGAVVGIRAASAGSAIITGNQLGGIDASGTTNSIAASVTLLSFGGAGTFNVSNNTLGNTTVSNIRQGCFTSGANLSNTGTNIAVSSASPFTGINNAATGNQVRISQNILQGWETSCSANTVSAISSSGTMSGLNPQISIDSNQVGTATAGLILYRAANSSFFYGITQTSSLTSSTQNIRYNDIRGISYSTATPNSGSHYLINISNNFNGSTVTRVSNNTFTSLSLNVSSSIYFIYNSFIMSSSGRMNIDSNRIAGSFTNTASSSSTHYISYTAGTSSSGGEFSFSGNDFSNISFASSSNFKGVFSQDVIRKIINGNTFQNWTITTGGVNVVELTSNSGNNTSVSGNLISNINAPAGSLTVIRSNGNTGSNFRIDSNRVSQINATDISGIYVLGNNLQAMSISNNEIHSLTATATGLSNRPIRLGTSGPSVITVSKNKIYNISSTESLASACGIAVFTTSPVTIVNNLIGDIKAPNSNLALSVPIVSGIREEGGGNSPALNIYYNSIHIASSGSGANFSAAAVYVFTNSALNLRNNILNCEAVPGSAGRSVALWYGGTNISNYQNTANNNLFYAGAPSSRNLIFYDGTNSDQTLPAFQSRVSPRDDKSISVQPQFISTNGADVSFLHLSPGNNCSILGAGDNTGILLSTDYDGDTRNTSFPFLTDIGADEASKYASWTGSNGTSWNDPANWSNGLVPNSTGAYISITNPPVNQPVIAAGETFQVGTIFISPEATLFNRGTLKISGRQIASFENIDNTQGGLVLGSMEYNGNCSVAQNIAGSVFKNNSVKNLIVSNDLVVDSNTGEEVKIAGTLSFGAVTGKSLATGDNIVLLSTATHTANLADVTGNSITGKATVERFINTGTIPGAHAKSWQFLAAPTTGQSIYNAWQEGGSNAPGYGTWITGTGSGFDAATALPALKYYNPATNQWLGETNTGNPVNNGIGYMIFIRGDRTVNTLAGLPVPTIMRSKGNLYQPNSPPPSIPVPAGLAATVANPYPSAIDIAYMRDNGLFSNLNNDVVVWDPLLSGTYGLGGYQTLSAANNYEPTAGGTSYYPAGVPSPVIQSGQAFFVRSSGSAGSVSFNEACKESGSRLVHRGGTVTAERSYFRVTLQSQDGSVADGNAVVFDPAFSHGIDAQDAVKMMNNGENLGIFRSGNILSVEARGNLRRNDTIFYDMAKLRRQSYRFAFAPKNLYDPTLGAWLIDRYLRTETPVSLSDSSFISFSVNNDSLSGKHDRFYVVFRKKARTRDIPVTVFGKNQTGQKPAMEAVVSVYPNPVVDRLARLHMTGMPAGDYNIRWTDLGGKEMSTAIISHQGEKATYTLRAGSDWAPGIYLLTIRGQRSAEKTLRVLIP